MKSSTKENIRTIQMPVRDTCRIISSHKNSIYRETFFITSITENEIERIKKECPLRISRDNIEFYIENDDVLCYGPIDFHNGSEDCKVIDTFGWLDRLGIKGICIPSGYNYDKHECIGNNKGLLWTETFKNSTLCRYLHGCIGKPEFTLIFRQIK